MKCLLLLVLLQLITYHSCVKKKFNYKSPAYWKQLAASQGPNICLREVVPRKGISYDRAWTGGLYCGTKTIVKFQCCEGYGMVNGDQGCPLVKPQVTFLETAERVGAGMFVKLQETSGLSQWITDVKQGAVTILAPSNKALKKLHNRTLNELDYEVRRASRFLDSPVLLLYHTLDGRLSLRSLPADSVMLSFFNEQPIRFSVHSNELVTANCVPIIEGDIQTSQGLLHILESPLDVTPSYNIADFISRQGQLRRLSAFITQADFGKMLRLTGPFTLFAPTDEAFSAMSQDSLQVLQYNEQALKALLQHHLVEGVHCSATLHNMTLQTEGGTTLRSRCTPKGTKVSNATIVKGNMMTSNGVVHLIDQVLIPRKAKSLTDLLTELGLTKFKALVSTSGLQTAFRGRGTITVFAPNNQAFNALGNNTVLSSQMGLRTLLAGHIVSGRHLTKSFLDKQNLRTFGNNKMLRTTLYNMKTMVNDALIMRPDVEGSNGVIHVINKVLVPPKFSILTYLQSEGNYTRFLAALNKTSPSLIDLLDSDNAPFTVFAVADSAIDNWTADQFTYDRMMADTRIVNSIMRNHVVPDTLFTSALVPGNYYQMMNLNSEPLLVRRWHGQRGPVYAGIALILKPDILCTNGVIHIINRLIQLANPAYS